MIDLDALQEGEELYCRLGAALVAYRISYHDWCTLVMWLGIYQSKEWIHKVDSVDGYWGYDPVSEKLIQLLEKKHRVKGSISWFNEVQGAIGSITNNYTEQQQDKIAVILEEANGSKMEKRPDFRGIIVEQEY